MSGLEVATSDSNRQTDEQRAERNAVETQQQTNTQQQQQNSFWGIARGLIFRFMIIYFITSYFRRPQESTQTSKGAPALVKQSSNLFENGTLMDLYIYVSENEFKPNFENPKELIWVEKGLIYGDWYGGPNGDSTYTKETIIETSPVVQNNGSLWIHVYIVRSDNLLHPSKFHLETFTIHKRKRLNRYKKKKYKKTHNLITGETSNSEETIRKMENKVTEEIISHWHPNLTINIVDDHTPWVPGHVPQPLDEFIDFEPTTGKYYPIVYINDYWNLLRDYQPINETVKSLSLYLTFHPLSMFRFQMYTAQAMRSRWASMFGSDMMEESEEEQDFVKEAFLETSPYLLALTVIVSITHSVFEFLAFKNDIQFWKNRSSLEGLSVRSVFFNVFQSVVVLLYVLDNDTNTIVKISVGVGLLIEIWKIHKVLNIQVNREQRMFFGLLPKVVISDKGSYVESSTKQYDLLAFRYLSWVLFPLLFCYAIYSLLYLEHKGFYSWVLSMLYGFLLTFGFIVMTPQLFINYKLKSVAHLPWRMLTYKFLNTFIDDIFAFVIKMPTMYRLGCFRDDIIFLIYLYQRWIYRVDPKRVNEFGVSGEDLDNAAHRNQDDSQDSKKDR
ncbi:cleft lip and palate transmembrane protein 1-like protein [Dinothrombium tinctorium]|uniref:Cleft lip and palate transmembrane protein 1-like protein n=1 Tax=Dinothrombium tinctorium TaxID=1965070 RepID=A0A3S3PCF0_9ACAR|nr:cleft lip and palate transmembrane protein 1-like protein [Dinothrombium tinctorium]RWS05697.1 cleft lip and palate transmembrane protein 1-like protein [Dinothrombium tinctorium]RWS13280.1 cleft lip and palate transmembrane protein 1-like protein [Dinothrombium tinctorium]RWS13303.1 cleft lip and palate transmembrane protein 1-like protein [Dinothrombium tinctorium]